MILLDTCALLWTMNQDPMLQAARRVISRAASDGGLYVSPVSAWEIGLLVRRGRLELEIAVESYIDRVFRLPGVRVAALTPGIAVRFVLFAGRSARRPRRSAARCHRDCHGAEAHHSG
jgi:PIN domain nuclease of toxin-antitoxin system